MQLFEVQAPLLGEIAPLLGGLVESAQSLLVSHEGARSRQGSAPLLLCAAVTATAACSQTLAAHATGGANRGPDLCESVFRNYPICAGNKEKPARWGGRAGRLDRRGGSGGRERRSG